ncbi:OmpP1/FadL family transporter [Acinetobacter indicus]|uniref:OmpP1/FadL family transporter n=1 Tax=Acinetobacter indicus TaxID=756892 RepID=UPI000CEBEA99|nr:transporter [Acinetobacter indicus]MDM1290521.1 transporter [Acinetobacter indicus]MDM1320627.1 transporter [Acinetobacter indicus]MDM1332463.1 transporter [Acinetobacter indicus]QIZ59717.1 transporter [Acinetobacter indicus]
MKLNKIYSAILLSTLPLTPALAGGLDRSGQSIAAFLQPGNYAEAGISVLDPKVQSNQLKVNDMAEDYYFPSAAIKVQATERISIGLLYDQPFGAESLYPSNNPVFAANGEATQVEVETHNLTALIGYQPTENWNFYAGPVWQTVKGNVSLRGSAYSLLSGYDINLEEDDAFGWLAGAAYQISEIALKAAVTYRSEIKHELDTTETSNIYIPSYGIDLRSVTGQTEVVTPQSVNIDFQTGIAKDTLAFANIRWVHWDQFAVSPTALATASKLAKGRAQNLIDYSDDQISATVGVGRKFNNQWSGSASVGYDSGAGNPVTTLGPTEGYWNVGLGAQYSPAENYFIQAGVKYFWLGDATARTGTTDVGEFEDNYALGYGLKIGYRF